VPSDVIVEPFGRTAVTLGNGLWLLCRVDRGIDVLCAPQSSIGGVVGVLGLCGVAMQDVGVGIWCLLIRLNLAIAWFKLLRISSRVFGNDADAVLHISSPSVHFGLGVQ
jgi:hypothetical protein